MRELIAIIFLLTVTTSVIVRSDDPVSSSVTFNREVVRIFQRKCLQCHMPGGIAMSLATYRDTRPWSRAIREELVEQRMPPWTAAPGYTPLAHDGALTAREMTTLLTWLDGGVPRGEERDLPRDTGTVTTTREPDFVLSLGTQQVPADEEYLVRRITVDPGPAAARRLERLQLRPSGRRVLRAAFLWSISPAGRQWLGAWTPWQDAVPAPDGSAFSLSPGAKIEIELHYRGRETATEDKSSLAFFYAPNPSSVLRDIALDPRAENGARRSVFTVRDAIRVWAIVPRPNGTTADGGSLEVTARRPDGIVHVLLWVPQYRHDWPTPYILREPVTLPAGTTVTMRTDASAVAGATLAVVGADPADAAPLVRR